MLQKGNRDQAVGNTFRVSGSGKAHSHETAAYQGEFWMKYVIAPAVCQGQPEGLERFWRFSNSRTSSGLIDVLRLCGHLC